VLIMRATGRHPSLLLRARTFARTQHSLSCQHFTFHIYEAVAKQRINSSSISAAANKSARAHVTAYTTMLLMLLMLRSDQNAQSWWGWTLRTTNYRVAFSNLMISLFAFNTRSCSGGRVACHMPSASRANFSA
jgi:hypothetical protein